jgi:hypothetical protein
MQLQGTLAVSGHVFCVNRKRGPQFYVKYRLGSKQIQRRLGPAWFEPGQPPPGYYTRKTAEAALAAILTDARRGAVPHSSGSGVTVREAADEWLRHCEWERGAKASTLSEYGSVDRRTSCRASLNERSSRSRPGRSRPGRPSCWRVADRDAPSTRS